MASIMVQCRVNDTVQVILVDTCIGLCIFHILYLTWGKEWKKGDKVVFIFWKMQLNILHLSCYHVVPVHDDNNTPALLDRRSKAFEWKALAYIRINLYYLKSSTPFSFIWLWDSLSSQLNKLDNISLKYKYWDKVEFANKLWLCRHMCVSIKLLVRLEQVQRVYFKIDKNFNNKLTAL